MSSKRLCFPPLYRTRLAIDGKLSCLCEWLHADETTPPNVANWFENASLCQVKNLHRPEDLTTGRAALPYWNFKVRDWEETKQKAKKSGKDMNKTSELDGFPGATQNNSFDPSDYTLPADPDRPMPYRLLIKIGQPSDMQPSLMHSVEIDNADPHAFQLLDLVGYPKLEKQSEFSKEKCTLYFVDDRFDSALQPIDSVLLTIRNTQQDLISRNCRRPETNE